MNQIEMDVARSQIRANNKISDHLSKVDWEQRRYELAKAAITGIVGSIHENYEYEYVAKAAVRFADAVIAELKKSGA